MKEGRERETGRQQTRKKGKTVLGKEECIVYSKRQVREIDLFQRQNYTIRTNTHVRVNSRTRLYTVSEAARITHTFYTLYRKLAYSRPYEALCYRKCTINT